MRNTKNNLKQHPTLSCNKNDEHTINKQSTNKQQKQYQIKQTIKRNNNNREQHKQ